MGGKWSPTRGDPNYYPTIFPTAHIKPKTQQDADRFSRLKSRQSVATYACELDENEIETVTFASKMVQTNQYKPPEEAFLFSYQCFSTGGTTADAMTQVVAPVLVSKSTETSVTTFSDFGQTTEKSIRPAERFFIQGLLEVQFKAFTGISKNMFCFFLEALGDDITDSRTITGSDKLALLFVKKTTQHTTESVWL